MASATRSLDARRHRVHSLRLLVQQQGDHAGRGLVEPARGRARPLVHRVDDRGRGRPCAGPDGISSTSAPALRAFTAAPPAPYFLTTAPICSESVTTSPSKPMLVAQQARSPPCATGRTGTPGSTARTSMWPTMTAGAPASMPDWKGTRSLFWRAASDLRLHREADVAVGGHRAVAREVLEDRDQTTGLDARPGRSRTGSRPGRATSPRCVTRSPGRPAPASRRRRARSRR